MARYPNAHIIIVEVPAHHTGSETPYQYVMYDEPSKADGNSQELITAEEINPVLTLRFATTNLLCDQSSV